MYIYICYTLLYMFQVSISLQSKPWAPPFAVRVQIESMKQIESFFFFFFNIFFRFRDGPQVQFVERFRIKDDIKSTNFNNTD